MKAGEPQQRSAQQEDYEAILNYYVWTGRQKSVDSIPHRCSGTNTWIRSGGTARCSHHQHKDTYMWGMESEVPRTKNC